MGAFRTKFEYRRRIKASFDLSKTQKQRNGERSHRRDTAREIQRFDQAGLCDSPYATASLNKSCRISANSSMAALLRAFGQKA